MFGFAELASAEVARYELLGERWFPEVWEGAASSTSQCSVGLASMSLVPAGVGCAGSSAIVIGSGKTAKADVSASGQGLLVGSTVVVRPNVLSAAGSVSVAANSGKTAKADAALSGVAQASVISGKTAKADAALSGVAQASVISGKTAKADVSVSAAALPDMLTVLLRPSFFSADALSGSWYKGVARIRVLYDPQFMVPQEFRSFSVPQEPRAFAVTE